MTQAALKLVDPVVVTDSLLFERRRDPRSSLQGQVTVVRSFRHDGERCSKISSITLRDISSTGVGAFAREPVEIGSDMVVMFPPHGPDGACDSTCRVVRCIKCEGGYEVGARFGLSNSAA